MSARAFAFSAALCALLAGSALAVRAQSDETLRLPGGPAKAQIVAACQTCHSVGLIVQQRLSEKSWTDELLKMERWGAPLDPAQNALVAAYLAKYFNPQIPATANKLVHSPK